MKDRIAVLELSQRYQFDIERKFTGANTSDRLKMYETMTEELDNLFFDARMASVDVRGCVSEGKREFGFEGHIKYFFGKRVPAPGNDYSCRAVASVVVIRER